MRIALLSALVGALLLPASAAAGGNPWLVGRVLGGHPAPEACG